MYEEFCQLEPKDKDQHSYFTKIPLIWVIPAVIVGIFFILPLLCQYFLIPSILKSYKIYKWLQKYVFIVLMQHIVFNFIQTITSNLTFIDFLNSEIKGPIYAQIHEFIFWIPVIPKSLIWRFFVWISAAT